MRYRPLRD